MKCFNKPLESEAEYQEAMALVKEYQEKMMPELKVAQKPIPFVDALTRLINFHSKENESNTPDYILAQYLEGALKIFNSTIALREMWYGRPRPGISQMAQRTGRFATDPKNPLNKSNTPKEQGGLESRYPKEDGVS